MKLLIGSTGYVGGHLSQSVEFEYKAHSRNIRDYAGGHFDLLVCAGLPAEKWRANLEPTADWDNTKKLAGVLQTMTCNRALLISTIDVYQKPVEVNEDNPGNLDGSTAYGVNRAWFERFFQTQFPNSTIVRLPGLFSESLKKNLVYDLIHGRKDQYERVNPNSTFQFINMSRVWEYCEIAMRSSIPLINLTSEPVTAQQVASCFGQTLTSSNEKIVYDVRSKYASSLCNRMQYMFSVAEVLNGISKLNR